MVKTMPSLYDSEQSVQPTTAHMYNTTVACTICSALYTPSQAHVYLLQAPPIASESAFMSMCHFCFRCRRPACPHCWDDVHGLCGACVEDVHLPFREQGESLPLNTTLLVSSSTQPKQPHIAFFPLVCVRPGHFQTDAAQAKSVVFTTEPSDATSPVSEVQQQKSGETLVHDEVVPAVAQEHKNIASMARRIERIMTILLGVVLFLIAGLIIIASFSEPANTLVAHVLHVDIRMEIEYLLQLIQQLH